MNQRQDVKWPTLLLASMTVYGFLLVWAQTDTIELTTSTRDHSSPMSPAGFNIVTGGNVSIELAPWHSTSTLPAVTTHVPTTKENPRTSLMGATIPYPTAPGGSASTNANLPAASTYLPAGTTGNNPIPRSMKKSRGATNFTGRLSIRVRIWSSASKEKAEQIFLQKACEYLQRLQLGDVALALGPLRTPMQCLAAIKN